MNGYYGVQPSTNAQWVYVNGLQEAKSQIVQPGQTTWMMDTYKPMAYVKAVDGAGKITFRAIQLTDVDLNECADDCEYATKGDLAKLTTIMDNISQRLNGLMAELGGANQ